MAQKRQICDECGRNLPVERHTAFWRKRTGGYATVCKDCMVQGKDPRDEAQFMPILKELDFPYVERTWITQFNKMYRKDPDDFDVKAFFGKYLRALNLSSTAGAAGKGFDATEELNANPASKGVEQMYTQEDLVRIEAEEAQAAERKRQEAERKQKEADRKRRESEQKEKRKAEMAKIKEDKLQIKEEKKRLRELASQISSESKMQTPVPQEPQVQEPVQLQSPPAYVPTLGLDEENIAKEFTDEDKKYLALKWGMLYKPSEWVTLEDKYQKYAAEYEMNVDREEVLRSICKTNLKMDQALDICDFKAYKDLSMVYDQLRKSGKFTESQNKEQATRDIDSIGELVAFVEGEGGIIPHFESPIDYPKDKIDFIIKDLKNYTVNLVKNELGLGDLIESFIEKVKENKTKSVDEMVEEGFTSVSDDLRAEAEARDFQRNQMSELEEESMRLVEEYGA